MTRYLDLALQKWTDEGDIYIIRNRCPHEVHPQGPDQSADLNPSEADCALDKTLFDLPHLNTKEKDSIIVDLCTKCWKTNIPE